MIETSNIMTVLMLHILHVSLASLVQYNDDRVVEGLVICGKDACLLKVLIVSNECSNLTPPDYLKYSISFILLWQICMKYEQQKLFHYYLRRAYARRYRIHPWHILNMNQACRLTLWLHFYPCLVYMIILHHPNVWYSHSSDNSCSHNSNNTYKLRSTMPILWSLSHNS